MVDSFEQPMRLDLEQTHIYSKNLIVECLETSIDVILETDSDHVYTIETVRNLLGSCSQNRTV